MELHLENLSKRFGSKTVLEQINFSMQSGDFLALVGSSGSGKSTILRLIAGLDQPSEGSILVDGDPVTGPGPDRGMVFLFIVTKYPGSDVLKTELHRLKPWTATSIIIWFM